MASPSASPSSVALTASIQPHHPQTPSNDPPMATPLSLLVPAQPLPPPPPPSSRRLPPPCWTPDETSALIDAYKDKWYSLRRGNLRASHWQDVSDDLHRRCPHAPLPKTPVQCRHKMEKLRKRYRAELQRAKSIPHHRFSSSWVYFSKMDSMEKGPSAPPDSSLFSLSSPPHLATVVTAAAAAAPVNDNFHDNVSDDDDDNNNNSYDPRRDLYNRNGFKIKIPSNSRNPSPNPNPNPNPNTNFGYKSKYGSINKFNSTPSPQFEDGMRYATAPTTRMANGSGNSRMNMGMNMDDDDDDNDDVAMMMRKKKKTSRLGKRERESRGDDAGLEMVEAIRVLGEGFVRMEKMKMEMMRETEKMRMEMEMKRTEMILDSQHRIVEAFAKTWADSMASKKDHPSC